MLSLYKNTQELKYQRLNFSDSCFNVTVPEEVPSHIVWDLTNLAVDMYELSMIVNAYKVKGVKIPTLVLAYVPNARADRVFVTGNAFPLQVTADFINNLGFTEVTVYDPHSQVSTELLNNVVVKNQLHCLLDTIPPSERRRDTVICSPDKGALMKAYDISKYLDLDLVVANKVRDIDTGRIILTELENPEVVEGKAVIICDDICDGGGTFLPLAKRLKEAGAKSVSLYVTHGIFAKGLEPFKGVIDKVYVHNLLNLYITTFDIQKFNAQ